MINKQGLTSIAPYKCFGPETEVAQRVYLDRYREKLT